MLKKSLSLLLGFILLVSTIPTTIFADSASLSALPEEMLNDIIDDGELVLADFSDITTAQQELESLVTVTSTDGATASISDEHLMSTGATSALELSNLKYDSASKKGSSFYIKSKYDTSVLPSSYSIRIYFGIKDDSDGNGDTVPIKFWSEIQNDGSWVTDSGFTFTINDKSDGGHHAINRYYKGSGVSQDWVEYNAECDGPLQFGLHVRSAMSGDNNTVYIEKITAALQHTTPELTAPTATVADGGVYTINDSYNPHSFALDFAEDVYMAPGAVTVTAGDSNITEAVNPTLSGNTLNLTFPSDIDYTQPYKVSLAKSKVRGATGKTLLADAVYNFTWNVVKMPPFTDGKLVLADFTNNPSEEYINSVITNTSDDITISSSGVHFGEGSLSSIEVAATADGTFYVKSAYSKDLLPDEYKIYMKFGIVENASNIRFLAYSGLGNGADATYTDQGNLAKGFTLQTSNNSHKEGLIREIATYTQINAISSFENELSFKINIDNLPSTCGNVGSDYPGNNKFYIEQIYVEADCQPLSYPIPSIDYGADAAGKLFGDCEYTLSFGTSLHYGEDALTLYHNDNVIDSDTYTVLLKGNDLVVKFKNELEDGIYKVVVDSDKILAKNGDVLYGDTEYAFSVNTPNSGLNTYYIGTIGTSADYKTARVPVLGTVDDNDIRFLAAVYNSDGSLAILHTDDLVDGELKFDSLTLDSTQTVKYMLLKDMDTIVPLCESVSNK